MSLIAWILLGLLLGFVGSRLLNQTGQGRPLDVAVGISGAVVGGMLFNAVLRPVTVGLHPWSLSAAAIGSACVLWVWHAFIRGT